MARFSALRAAKDSTRPRGDVGVMKPPRARRSASPEMPVLEVSDSEDDGHGFLPDPASEPSDPGSSSGLSSDSEDSGRDRRHQRKKGAKAVRRAAAGASSEARSQVRASRDAENMVTTMERMRLIRETTMSADDPRANSGAVANMYKIQAEKLCRAMQRRNFVRLEPNSGDELQSDIDYMVEHGFQPALVIKGLHHALERSVPRSSALEKLQQRSSVRMAKFVKIASAEANRGFFHASGAPTPAPQIRPPNMGVVLGVGATEPKMNRAGAYITCMHCQALGHYQDACPVGGGGGGRGGGHFQDGGGRGRGGRGRGRGGRNGRGGGVVEPVVFPLAIAQE